MATETGDQKKNLPRSNYSRFNIKKNKSKAFNMYFVKTVIKRAGFCTFCKYIFLTKLKNNKSFYDVEAQIYFQV